MTWLRSIVLGCCLLGLPAGCDTQEQQNEFLDDAFAVPEGFTRTNRDGEVVTNDPDDWRTAPFYATSVLVDPAFPNPSSEGLFTFPVSIREFNAVPGGLELASLDANNRFVPLDVINDVSDPGRYDFREVPILARLGRRGLIRVFILDGRGELVSYGDVFVE